MSEKYTNEKYVVTWDMFHMHARKLAERLLPATQWKGIIAVSRGGLFPAAVLARELKVLHAAQTDGEGFIVVDDLVDTGNTAREIRKMYPKAKFVTVFAKPAGAPLVDDYVIDIPQETWIEQPWDLGITFVPPLAKK